MTDDTNNAEPVRDWQTDSAARKSAILAALDAMGLTMESTFIPFSKSRQTAAARLARGEVDDEGKASDWLSLNWSIKIYKAGRSLPILETTYSAGQGHAPCCKAPGWRQTIYGMEALTFEIEKGFDSGYNKINAVAGFGTGTRKPILPDFADVMYSLVSESDVIDYNTFEDWASNFGYNPDSRRGESVYRSCLETTLKLRNGIGESNLAKLRELFQDY